MFVLKKVVLLPANFKRQENEILTLKTEVSYRNTD